MLNPPPATSKLFSLGHLAIITVSGPDSAQFLQGQLSCDINSLTNSQASVAAFCNPKGRVISTLLVVKTSEDFLLILPASLLEKVTQKLQMYILRSKVQLHTPQPGWQLYGLQPQPTAAATDTLCLINTENKLLKLSWSSGRKLCLSQQDVQNNEQGQPTHEAEWIFQDINAGFPWFEIEQSELYTPQMLNIDGLGGVSFNKGCYTGQEIIARTHYLGAAKRHLYLAESQEMLQLPQTGAAVLDAANRQSLGSVLRAGSFSGHTRLLLVLQGADIGAHNLILDDGNQTAIKLTHI